MTMTLKDTPDALRGLAKVIREHGTCAPMAVEHVADAIDAYLTQPAQSVDVADVRLLLECVKDEHGGDHFEAGCRHCAAFDRLTAAIQEKGNGSL